MTELRQSLAETMVSVHLISLDLAAYHVLRMDDEEVEFKFWSYFKVSGPVARVAQGAIGNLTIHGMGETTGPESTHEDLPWHEDLPCPCWFEHG